MKYLVKRVAGKRSGLSGAKTVGAFDDKADAAKARNAQAIDGFAIVTYSKWIVIDTDGTDLDAVPRRGRP